MSNRIIKARCWDKKTKQWKLPARCIHTGFDAENSRYVFQMYVTNTIADESVKREVYEGDIVNFHWFYFNGWGESEDEVTGQITWHDHDEYDGGLLGYFGILVHDLKKWRKLSGEIGGTVEDIIPIPLHILNAHEMSFTVLGNIFETPELIPDWAKKD